MARIGFILKIGRSARLFASWWLAAVVTNSHPFEPLAKLPFGHCTKKKPAR
jgi:hypothetical protein